MRHLSFAFTFAAILTLDSAVSSDNSQAAILYPWCAHYLSPHGVQNCGFVTWEQCLAAIGGNGGTCEANPFYTSPSASTARRRPARQN